MDDIFIKCPHCGQVSELEVYQSNLSVCSNCGANNYLSTSRRLEILVNRGSFRELNGDIGFHNPIGFPGYDEKYNVSHKRTGLNEAVVTGIASIGDYEVTIGVLDSGFMMGSMGTVVGEKITCLFEEALTRHLPVIIFSASGGARMQEGIFSLMQMAKTSAAVEKYSDGGGLFISVLTNPTTGGVSASFAFLGDIILAEPQAVIGFAGARVIKQTIGEYLPEGFQTAEYLLEHGLIDNIVERNELRETLIRLLDFHRNADLIQLGRVEE